MPPVSVKKVTLEDGFYHVRFRPPSQFERIRTPTWTKKISRTVSQGSKVRMGRTPAGNWLVQSVLISNRNNNKTSARRSAIEIIDKIERGD